MRVQVVNDVIVAWGVAVLGDDTYDGAPEDYSPDLYDYIPETPGVYSPLNFIRKPDPE